MEPVRPTATPPHPILMRPDETVNIKRAVELVNRSDKTIRGWCREFRIGSQASHGAPLDISAPALLMLKHGDLEALELLRSGDRHAPAVARYYDFLGLQA